MTLRDNIDTNKNNHIDVSSQRNEITDFILDKNKWEENLNELWKHLNDLDPWKLDNLWIKDALQSYFNNPERTRLDQEIKNKVNKNELITKKELNLLYLEMISKWDNQTSFQKQKFNPQQLKFDSTQPIEKICNWALISYIKNKYNNPLYVWKKTQIELTNQHKKTSKNPLDKIQENQLSDINLPENIWEIKESEADFYCNRLITRAENNFSNEISKAKREIEQKHRYKDEAEKKAYIKRDTLLIAFSKYTEAVNKKNEKLITNSWYKDKDNFQNQMKLMEEFWNEIQNKYPNINEILSKLKKFDEEMKNNEKKYFNDENETNKAEQDYKEFNEYMDKKSKEYGIDKIQESLKKEPKTKEEMEEYLQTMNKIFEFQEDLNKKNKTYWDSISKYQKYIKWIADIQKKYDIQQYQDILEKYNQDISNWNKKIDFKKYENYKNWLDWKLEVWIKNINTLEWIITDPQSEYFPIKQIKDIERKKQIKQEWIDRFRKRIKEFDPRTYWMLTTFTGLWNWLIDATVWAWTSLGVMILGIIWWKDETLAQMDRKERRDNVLKINQSSSQKEWVYNPETGFNFHADNTVSTVASSISQMLTLIYWWWAIWWWASKALWISENIAWKVWLFTSSFITQVWWNYQEAITHWLTWKNAIWYSFLSATIQSSLELISPNEVLLWKWNWIAKELIKNACNEWWKQSFMLIWKTFLKNVWLEIIEENIQEWLQTVAWNLINMVVNWTYWSDLWADWSWKNFASTAIITTLTTWITTWVSTWVQMYEMSNQDQTKLLEDIKSNNWLYLEVIWMLDKAIEGGVKIPNVSTEQLQNLKLSLTWNSDTNTPSANTNIPHSTDIIETDYEIKTWPEIEQISQILWSRFHEERRQSRLQSDWTYAPRVEKTSDQTWISQHNWQTEVDIANTPFEDLPSDWKSENLEAAKVAVGLVYDIVKKWEKVTSEMIEKMAEIVHNKRLERNWIEWSFENQRVHYEQLSEVEKEKDRNQLLQAIETVKQWNTDYFNWKPHKIFEGNTQNAKSNSNLSDRILSEINEENKSEKLEELRKEITEQYKQTTWEELKLTDEQLLSILDAHEQDWKLWELTLWQLRQKVKVLNETITDPEIRRFLLEAWFCGRLQEVHQIEKWAYTEMDWNTDVWIILKAENLRNIEKTEFIQDYFNIENSESIEELKEKWDYLYFDGKNKRKEFKDAILDWNFELAKKLYIEALNTTQDKLKKVWLTPEQNKFIVDCFRNRDAEGIKKILNEKKDITKESTETEDTEKKYSKKIKDKKTWEEKIEYDNIEKALYKDPITEKEVLMTRRELHERIIEKFLLDWEASKWKKQLIMSWWLPGAGKSTIEKSLEGIPKVIVNPDLVKDYLPEYYDEQWRKFWAWIVHEESSYISKIIYNRALEWWYSILYDSSMKDKPNTDPPFPKYNKIVESAYNKWYTIEARFIYDWWESRYRNAVIRERSMWLDNYNAYWTAYKTIEFLSKDIRVNRTIIYDNSGNGTSSQAKIVYENQEINMGESNPELIEKFNEYQLFLDKLL